MLNFVWVFVRCVIHDSYNFFKNSEKEITGFYSAGHAGYAESGSDIICSAISVLTINTINSIEAFTDDKFDVSVNEDEGIVIFKIAMPVSPETSILLKSYELGVSSVAEDNPKYLSISVKEV